MFENFRTAFDQDGRPMRVTVTVFPTDRNQFIVNVGEVPTRHPRLRTRITESGLYTGPFGILCCC